MLSIVNSDSKNVVRVRLDSNPKLKFLDRRREE